MSRLSAILAAGLCLGLAACKRDDGATSAPKVPVVAPQPEGLASVWGARKLSELEIAALIEELDTVAREHTGLDQEAAKLLLGKLGGGPPATMGVSTWHHFLNSALNALGTTRGVSADEIAQVLLPMVDGDSDKVVRLYALQHLGIHQPRVSEPLRSQIGRRVLELAKAPDEEVAGTAMALLEQWKGELGAEVDSVSTEVRGQMAAMTMADKSRPVDVRTSAVHMAVDGGYIEALVAAREIAENSEESTTLRKACIHLIGQLGSAHDQDLLNRCAKENTRMAQAANPALEAILARVAGRAGPAPTPYQ